MPLATSSLLETSEPGAPEYGLRSRSIGFGVAKVGDLMSWWSSTIGLVCRCEDDSRRLDNDGWRFSGGGGLPVDFLRGGDLPMSSRKSEMELSTSFLLLLSSTSGSRYLEICFGKRSGLPSTISPSASIGHAMQIFSSRLHSSSG